MIKNVVFDCGQVIIKFDPDYMVRKYIQNDDDVELLKDVIFDRLYWDRLDSGDISDEEVVRLCCERVPSRLHKAVSDIYNNWIYNCPEIEGMSDLVKELKYKYGARVFLLSNISETFAAHDNEFPIYREFEYCVYSAVCKVTKPHREIYDYLCKKGNLNPNETIFVDDSKINIKGAQDYGIHGYLFDGDVPKLRNYLIKIIKEKIDI